MKTNILFYGFRKEEVLSIFSGMPFREKSTTKQFSTYSYVRYCNLFKTLFEKYLCVNIKIFSIQLMFNRTHLLKYG